jgi:diguanylate cyclase (GGDEF)-like protein
MISRVAMHALVEEELAAHTKQNRPFALVLFDIDRFKLVNFGFGDSQGDAVLQRIADTARANLRPADIVGRWGGQQFMCVLPGASAETGYRIAEKIRVAIETQAMHIDANVIHATASFGVGCFPADGRAIRQLLSSTDAALYEAKESGRNRTVLAGNLQHQTYGIGNLVESALREDRLRVAYQPIVDLQSGQVVAEEALARIVMPDNRIMPAQDFIESARLLQLTYKIDRAVMLQTMGRCATLLAGGTSTVSHFINISGNLLRHPDVVQELLGAAMQTCQSCGDRVGPVKPLIIEVTERELLGDIDQARALLKPFVDFGLRLALDDFGSGYSSFHYLAELPFSFLKIEGSLVTRLVEPRVRTIVQGIQNIANDLGLTTVAEFVENATVADIARDLGVSWAQGYHFGEPQLL